jgi:hypothetical protein
LFRNLTNPPTNSPVASPYQLDTLVDAGAGGSAKRERPRKQLGFPMTIETFIETIEILTETIPIQGETIEILTGTIGIQ